MQAKKKSIFSENLSQLLFITDLYGVIYKIFKYSKLLLWTKLQNKDKRIPYT